MKNISIIVPTRDEEHNIRQLVERIHAAVSTTCQYEIIFIDDNSRDKTQEIITALSSPYPLSLFIKEGIKGKAQSLIEGFRHAKYEIICTIDADLQYPPEAIPAMLQEIEEGTADIVIANRQGRQGRIERQFVTNVHRLFLGKLVQQLDCDVQSGLKVFRKEVTERLPLNSSPWAFELAFLLKAKNAGYVFANYDIIYAPRLSGKTKIHILPSILHIGYQAVKLRLQRPEIVPFHPNTIKEKGYGFHYKGQEFIHHSKLTNTQSAFHRLSGFQIVIISLLLLDLALAVLNDWHLTLVVIFALITFLYFIDLLFNLFLVYRSFNKPEVIQTSDAELSAISNTTWPMYTVLCPLYKEAHVLPQFVKAMSELEYPKDKLQIMLLLEADDTETIASAKAFDLPDFFDIVIVPHSLPKTKPKACNYGLLHAKGEYIVIYDAEDIPDPLQLKKAVVAFSKGGEQTICVQAKLNFYNPHQNLLTRVFTAEYSLWFDLVLTGLQSIHAPIPLGGTSNHFRATDLDKLKGWDSFNVTEDCDLGIRLVKLGYQTALIDSTTLEEANSDMKNWFWQRTRWIKGYMQTYLLHMRNPLELLQNWKEPHAITFQLVVGGKVMSMFINPVMWFITICYFLFRAHVAGFIESFFPTYVLYLGVFSLVVGNFLYMYYYMIGCVKHGHFELVKYVIFVPFYWLGMSLAAWVAFYKLIVAPHQWSKTKHGLHLQKQDAATSVPAILEQSQSSQKINDEYVYKPSVSICVPAYNEEKNIERLLHALIAQETTAIRINKIIVVSSASTDTTDSIVENIAQDNSQVMLIKQAERQGKAAAINEFLKHIQDEIVVIESADTTPRKDCIDKLCAPFVYDKTIGMTGGAPHPVNDPNTFLGYVIHAWWWFHRNIPRFGEIIAYRNIFPQISATTSVDEAYIQAQMAKLGYNIVHVDSAVIYNKGAENIRDLIKQRRRVMNGHARLHKEEGVKINNMTKSSFKLMLFEYKFRNLKQVTWFFGGISIEVLARILGAYDYHVKNKNPFVWDIAGSTKDLSKDKKKMQIVNNTATLSHQQPLISIIMPVYNVSRFISYAINSILEQSYTNWELIIIDDGSTDHTLELAQIFTLQDTRVHYIRNEKNQGQTKSMNDGITLAKGEFIARIDGDDIWVDTDKLKKQAKFLLDHQDYGLVGSFAHTIDTHGNKLTNLTYPILDRDIRKYLFIESCFIHSSVLIRKSILDQVNTYNERYSYAQDYDLWLRMGIASKLHNIPEFMVHYRINPKGITQTKYHEQIAETIQIVKKYKKRYKNFMLGMTLWHMRTFLPRNFRETISRQSRKTLFLNKYSIN